MTLSAVRRAQSGDGMTLSVADKAALIYAMEPIFAALFAWWWLSEGLTVKAVLGGAMVVGAVVLYEWRGSKISPQ